MEIIVQLQCIHSPTIPTQNSNQREKNIFILIGRQTNRKNFPYPVWDCYIQIGLMRYRNAIEFDIIQRWRLFPYWSMKSPCIWHWYSIFIQVLFGSVNDFGCYTNPKSILHAWLYDFINMKRTLYIKWNILTEIEFMCLIL